MKVVTFDLPKFASFCRTERFGRSKVNIGRSKVNIGRSKVNIGRSKVTTPPSSRRRNITVGRSLSFIGRRLAVVLHCKYLVVGELVVMEGALSCWSRRTFSER